MTKEPQEEIKLSQVLNINLAETLAHMPEKGKHPTIPSISNLKNAR